MGSYPSLSEGHFSPVRSLNGNADLSPAPFPCRLTEGAAYSDVGIIPTNALSFGSRRMKEGKAVGRSARPTQCNQSLKGQLGLGRIAARDWRRFGLSTGESYPQAKILNSKFYIRPLKTFFESISYRD